MATVTEIADDVFRISTYIERTNIQFNQFLVRDEEPLLYHTGHRHLFADVVEAVARLIDPATVRHIGFSHIEADECASLRDWQRLAPRAEAFCSIIGKRIGVDDFIAERPARALQDGAVIETGRHRLRFLQTPQVPHGWDASLLFDEHERVLFCSDLFHQNGNVEAITEGDIVGRFRHTLTDNRDGPTPGYMAFTAHTGDQLRRLAELDPRTLAAMHGSTFTGNGRSAIDDAAQMMAEVLA